MFDDYIITWAPLINGRTYLALDYPVYHYLIGRPGQSMSMAQQRKGALSYVKCFQQYELVRSLVEENSIPKDLLKCIDNSITGYAGFVFPHMVYLPYKEAKKRMRYLWDNYLSDKSDKSKLQKRYSVFPFLLFYCMEQVRNRINK